MIYSTHSVKDTQSLGAQFASKMKEGDIIVLDGELGCGKTEFVRGLVASFNCDATVRSPSFSIVNTYSTQMMPIYHFDFYRLEHADELIEIGFEEYCSGSGLCLIEWGLMFPEVLPSYTLIVSFKDMGSGERQITLPIDL